MSRASPAALFCLLATAWVCVAQQPVAGLRQAGVVRSSGQPIPGATLSAALDGRKLTTTTDEEGQYQFDNLSPGQWTFEVQMTGFSPAQKEIEVGASPTPVEWSLEVRPTRAAGEVRPRFAGPNAQQRRPLGFQNLPLTAGADNTERQVQAAVDAAAAAPAPLNPTAEANANEAFLLNGSLSGGFETALKEDLLAQGRGQWELNGAMLRQGPGGPFAPGAGGPGDFERGVGGGPPGPRGGPGFGRGGFGGRGGPGGPGGFGERGPGRGKPGERPFPGGAFGNRIGRGQQGLRGSLFFSLHNSALDARPFSLTGQTVEKPPYAQSRFGVVMGGPLKIPKLVKSERTFLFFTYFGTRGRDPYQAVSTLPTGLERQGDFSQSGTGTPSQIFDPVSKLLFRDNRIPASRIDPAARGLLSFIPPPNQPGLVQNYQYVTSVRNSSDNLGLRMNRPLSQNNRLDLNTNVQLRGSTSAQLYGFRDWNEGLGFNLGTAWMHTFNRTTINNLRWNFSRNRNEVLPFFAFGPNVAAALGITGVSGDPVNYGPPNLVFTNFGGLTDASPLLRRDQTAGVSEGLTLVRGSHTITVGGEYRRMQLNTRTDQNARGTFTFTGLATSAFNDQGQPLPGTGNDFADFLLGLPQSSSVRFGDSNTYFRAAVWSAYAQEDWRVRPTLTLNLGLRYEFFEPFHEKYNRIANLDLAPLLNAAQVVTPGQIGPYSGQFPMALVDPDKNNFSPRLALAWRPLAKRQLLVRAGYGLFCNGSIYSQFPSRLAAQPPFASAAQLTTSLARPLTLEDGFAAEPSQTVRNTYAVDRRYRVGYAQSWNFSLQQTLPHALVMELGYLGTKGTRLDIQRMPNRAAPGSPLTAEDRRRIGNAAGFTWDTSDGNSIYHAAQVRLTRRFTRGFSANLFYTFSKSIDNASTLGGGAAVVAQNDRDLRAERGLSSFDQRHVLSVFYILTSPVSDTGKLLAGSPWATRLFRDWSLSGGVTASSGTPFTARVLGNQADTGGTGAVGSGRADATGEPLGAGAGFFNLAAFAIPGPGAFGNAGRNTIAGPTRLSLNLSVSRSFRLDEGRRLELRMDSQNFTNHVSFTGLGTVVNATNYGLPTAAASMRTIITTLRLRF